MVALVLVTTAVGVYLWWLRSQVHIWTDNAYVVGNITPVGAEVSGSVVALYTDDNMVVQAGDPLAQLDPVPYQVAVDQAAADVAQARAEFQAAQFNIQLARENQTAVLQGAEAKVREYQELLQSTKLDVENKRQVLAKSREALSSLRAQLPGFEAVAKNTLEYRDRYARLAARGDVPIQQRDDKETAYQEAKAKVDAQIATIAGAERQVEADRVATDLADVKVRQTEQSLEQMRATLGQAQATQLQPRIVAATAEAHANKLRLAEAKLEQARLQLGYTLVRAPQSGIISRRTIQLGQTVGSRQAFLSIVPLDLHNVWIVANLREDQMDRIRLGQPVAIHIDAIPERSFSGFVESLAGGTGSVFSLFPPDNATGNFTRVVQRIPVRIRFSEPENWQNRIRPGMSVHVTIDTTKGPQA